MDVTDTSDTSHTDENHRDLARNNVMSALVLGTNLTMLRPRVCGENTVSVSP